MIGMHLDKPAAHTHLVAADSELTELPGGSFWHRGPTTGNAWTRVPLDALLAVAVYVEKAA